MEKLLNIVIGIVLIAVVAVGGLLGWNYLHPSNDFVGSKLDKDLQEWEAYVDDKPGDPLGRANLGAIYHERGDDDKAIEQLETAVELAPEGYTFRFKLGQIYRVTDRRDEALETMKQALTNTPTNERAAVAFEIAEMYFEMDDMASALDFVGQSIAADATIWNSRYLKGQIHEKQGENDKARSEYELAVKFSPDPAVRQALERVS